MDLDDKGGTAQSSSSRGAERSLVSADYTVGWICAVTTEYVAAQAFLDEKHSRLENKSRNDNNDYTLGKIGRHNVVIAVLPLGEYGMSSATGVAKDMLYSFPNVRIGLMVGIGGGAPSQKQDIRLGDVVVSAPSGGNGGVFQYDFGKTIEGQSFHITSFLGQPPIFLLTAVNGLRSDYEMEGHRLEQAINKALEAKPRLRKKYKRPDASTDRLYRTGVTHPANNEGNCDECCGSDSSKLIPRSERDEDEDDNPAIHYGLIGSANSLMKDAFIRDKLSVERGILCFEMEAAGLMNQFPCLVVRGICDYSDTHKNKEWQGYAAMAAAAYTKDLLCRIPPNKIEAEKRIGDILSVLAGVQQGIKEVIHVQHNQANEAILNWLTPTEYGPRHSDFLKTRVSGTGQWLIDSEEYQTWLKSNKHTLFCPGIPGSGKTILTATVVDDLITRFQNDPKIGIAYIYCQFKQKQENEQNIENLLASLLKQLARSQSLPESVKNLHDRHQKGKTRPSAREISGVLQSVVASYSKTFIIVDALDECQAADRYRAELLSCIFGLQVNTETNFFATSRPIPDIEAKFKTYSRREILATNEDVRRYMDRHMLDLPGFVHTRPDIQENIKTGITRAVEGMFLLARLYLDSLKDKTSEREINSALGQLVQSQSGLREDNKRNILEKEYAKAMVRINSQMQGFRLLARKILSWILCAKRQLTIAELQHALAVEIGDTELHKDNLRDINDMVSVCAGLVTVDYESNVVRLVHYTTQEYFERTQNRWFPNAETDITKVCITYLSFSVFESGFCRTDDENTNREEELIVDRLAFLEYAVRNWGIHFRQADSVDGSEIVPLALTICDPDSRIHAVWVKNYWKHVGVAPEGMTRLIVSSYLGLDAVVKLVLAEGANLEAKDSRYGRTPLSWAACEGHASIVSLLLERGAVLDTTDGHGQTPLSLAAENGREVVVQLLLEKEGVDKNSRSSAAFDSGRSPLSYAAQKGHEQVVNMLLSQEDVAVDLEDNSGKTPLLYAAAAANSRIAHALINHRASVSRTDYKHKGMLHHAINNADSEPDEVELFIKLGAPTELVDADNMTPLHYTVRFARTDIAELLLQSGVPVDIPVRRRTWNPDATEPALASEPGRGLTPLHCAALVGQEGMVSFFLRHDANVNALSEYGVTPVHLTLAPDSQGTNNQDYWSTDHWKVEIILDIVDVTDDEEYDEAQRGVLARRIAVLNTLLDDPKADINIRDHNGETALHKVRYGKLGSSQFVERLLQMNAESTSRYRDNRTPLHLACAQKDVQSVSLLAPRSQLALSDIGGQNALHFACDSACVETMTEIIRACEAQGVDLSSTRDTSRRNALHCYAKRINVDVEGIQRLLDYGVATGETDAKGDHPISVYLGRYLGSVEQDICRLLLAGVDPKHVNTRGLTFAQIYAVHRDMSVPVLKCLKEIGVPLTAIDEHGRHLLHHLALHGSLTREVLEFILSNTSLTLGSKDNFGKSPRQYAEEKSTFANSKLNFLRRSCEVSAE